MDLSRLLGTDGKRYRETSEFVELVGEIALGRSLVGILPGIGKPGIVSVDVDRFFGRELHRLYAVDDERFLSVAGIGGKLDELGIDFESDEGERRIRFGNVNLAGNRVLPSPVGSADG
jgi:hypothetical protein